MKLEFDVKEILRLSLTLFIICAIAATLLALANSITTPKISENIKATQTDALKKVMPDASNFKKIDLSKALKLPTPSTVYSANTPDSKSIGYCVNLTVSGYNPGINLIVGVTNDLTVTGYEVISQSETPGLGTNITSEKFKSQFVGKKKINIVKGSISSKDDVSAITSATISSKAVGNAVNTAIEIAKIVKEGGE